MIHGDHRRPHPPSRIVKTVASDEVEPVHARGPFATGSPKDGTPSAV